MPLRLMLSLTLITGLFAPPSTWAKCEKEKSALEACLGETTDTQPCFERLCTRIWSGSCENDIATFSISCQSYPCGKCSESSSPTGSYCGGAPIYNSWVYCR